MPITGVFTDETPGEGRHLFLIVKSKENPNDVRYVMQVRNNLYPQADVLDAAMPLATEYLKELFPGVGISISHIFVRETTDIRDEAVRNYLAQHKPLEDRDASEFLHR